MNFTLPPYKTRMIRHLRILFATFLALMALKSNPISAQTNTIVLGRPTDTSITVSIQFSKDVDFFIEYGTTPGIYNKSTPTISHKSIKPDEVDLHNLYPNTQYYYRVNYKLPGATSFSKEPEHHFHTQRPAGEEFTFTIEADEHLYDKKGSPTCTKSHSPIKQKTIPISC